MKSNQLFFIGFSAVMYNLALQFPYVLGWLTFFMFVPLFYLVVCEQVDVRFPEGFFWGLLFFAYHFYAVCSLTIPPFSPLGMFLGYFVLVIYGAFSAGCWFELAHSLAQYRPHNILWVLSCWLIITYGYFRWIATGMLLIMGVWKGYPLISPLVPLAAYPSLLSYISIVGSKSLLFLLMSAQAMLVLWLVRHNFRFLGAALVLLIPFYSGCIVSQASKVRPDCLDIICYLKPPDHFIKHPLDAAQEIYYALEEIIENNPHVRIIIAPESTYRFSLEENHMAKKLWTSALKDNDSLFIVGAYKTYGDNLINCLYLLSCEGICASYAKTCPMPIIEYLPFVSGFPGQDDHVLYEQGGAPLLLPGIGFFSVYVCSDFFLDHSLNNKNYKKSILLIVNDRWSTERMMGDLMLLYAALVAQETESNCMYISHYRAAFLTSSGSVFPLLKGDL